MVCQRALEKRHSRAKAVNASIGVSGSEAAEENGEKGKSATSHATKGIKCVWIFTGEQFNGSSDGSYEDVRVSLCNAKRDSRSRGHSDRGMKLHEGIRVSP